MLLQDDQSESLLGENAPTFPDAPIASELEPTSLFLNAEAVQAPLDIFHGYLFVFVFAFLTTVLFTPIMRRLAVANGIVDRPSESRKVHRIPIAYLGGIAVFAGIVAGIFISYIGPVLPQGFSFLYTEHNTLREPPPGDFSDALFMMPFTILLGMTVITITGLWDDVFGLDPRLKIAGQLLAAAALALDRVGTDVAGGVMRPIGRLIGNESLTWVISLPFPIPLIGHDLTIDLIYWTGTAIIAIFILGACNASNLVDGLDGLLSGITAIAVAGLLVIALMMAAHDDGPLDAARIVLCLALLGACMGFLPHNFNPATIFLGDCGSLLLGYTTIVIILTLGATGKTHFVIAGLIIYAIPIIDTVLAIARRKLAGKRMSDPDDQHLHHMLKRALGVKGAVLVLYAIGIVFAALGVWLVFGRTRLVFTIALVFAAYIGVTAFKVARRQAIEAQAQSLFNPPSTDPTSHPIIKHQDRDPAPTK